MESHETEGGERWRRERTVVLVFVGLYVGVVVHAAWLSDDAFIAFRAAANMVRGFGLVSNPPERVQAFTSPLLTLVFAVGYTFVRSAYTVGMSLGILGSTCTALLVGFGLRASLPARVLGLLLLTVSAATVDYSTSGLENPIAHLLIAAFGAQTMDGLSAEADASERGARRALLLVGLVGLTRLDLLLVVAPAVVALSWRHRNLASLRALALGLVPLVLWELFAIVYYGFPFPNTAYAKLNLAIPRAELVEQGLRYLQDSWQRDPVTLAVVFGVGVVSTRRVLRPALPVACGAMLYVAYVVWVGGDFMSGRFLTVPFVLSVVVLVLVFRSRSRAPELASFVVVAVYGAVSPVGPLRERDTRCIVPSSGVVDERACYETHTALRYQFDGPKYRSHEYYRRGLALRRHGPRVSAGTLVGMTGYAAGPHVFIVDLYALTDPVLARTPFVPHGRWRVGHFFRPLPAGYLESIRSGHNLVPDPDLHEEIDEVWKVVRGPLFTTERWAAIWTMNVGG